MINCAFALFLQGWGFFFFSFLFLSILFEFLYLNSSLELDERFPGLLNTRVVSAICKEHNVGRKLASQTVF